MLSEDNVKKLLDLIPLICERGPIHLDELHEITQFKSKKELRRNLELLLMFGRVPFTPLDFISIYIDDEERVSIDFPLGLEKPLALSSEEWLCLKEMLQKQTKIIYKDKESFSGTNELLAKLSSVPLEIITGDPSSKNRNLLQESLQENVRITFDYLPMNKTIKEIYLQRKIEPWALLDNKGSTYMLGYCCHKKKMRSFRIVRMQNINLLNEYCEEDIPNHLKFYIKESQQERIQVKGTRVQLAFVPDIENYLRHNLQIEEVKIYKTNDVARKHWCTAYCHVADQVWTLNFLRSLGPLVEICSPIRMRREYKKQLAQLQLPALRS